MTQQFDEARAQAFAGKMMDVLNHGTLALMISIGHRTGLFDTMSESAPMTSHELAEKTGLNERYVREWLGATLTARVVEYDPESRKFHLPPEHAAFTTRAASPNNIAAFMQYIAVLGSVEDRIVECFEKGGGVPYAGFPRFQAVMAEDSGQSVVPALESHILPLVPGLLDALERGIDVLDLGCGAGRALNLMARRFPRSRFTGIDWSDDGLAYARAEAARHGTTNITFEARDATNLDITQAFDLICTFDAIHDQVYPDRVLAGIARALRSDGVYLMQDIRSSAEVHENVDHPAGTFLYTISCMHCMTVSLSGGGAGLGAMWGDQTARRMLREVGFTRIDVNQLAHDFQNNYYVCRFG
jgi:SAM-dependent methyltransferase